MRLPTLAASLFALILVILGTPAQAAMLSERSPVRLGLWWDPAHSGSGFELFQGGEQTVLVWYTYRADGSPIWYSANAAFDEDGNFESPLYRQRWADGARATPSIVGSIRIERRNFESLVLDWELAGRRGEQSLQPFPMSGLVPEIDHSGAWYEPARSGYGLSLSEQGEWLAAGLYFYDAAGEPTWRVGDNGGRGRELVMRGVTGKCPGCAAVTSEVFDQGSLQLEFDSETGLSAVFSSQSAAWSIDAELVQLSTPASQRPADRQLAAFDDEATLRRYLDDAFLSESLYFPQPTIDFSPAPTPTATESFSLTNVQEAGVDEADRLKTDGSFLYTIAREQSSGDLAAVRVAEVREQGSELVMHSQVALPGSADWIGYSGLYLTDDTLVALQGTVPSGYASDSLWLLPQPWTDGSTRVTLLDRSTPATPSVEWTAEFDAHLVASRRIGQRLYLVLRKTTYVPGLEYGSQPDAARDQRNLDLIAGVSLADMLPRLRTAGEEWQALVDPADVHLPVVGSLQPSPQFISVVSIDLDAPDEMKSMAVLGSVNAVYVSPERMYIATSRTAMIADPLRGGYRPEGFAVTDVHEIGLGDDGPRFVATGAVEGYLDRDPDRAPFRFSERDGKLRLVTVGGPWGDLGQNRLTVLEPSEVSPGLLRTLSYLPNRDAPAPLGKPDEHLYGTRFVGDRLYAVTFLKIDPLYVVDLSDPAAPRIAGELELPGFSDYLHPIGDDVLLGIGLDARVATGWGDSQFAWFQGLLFSLFDVSDPAAPRLLQQQTLGKRGTSSAVLYNHHALSVLPGTAGVRFALPVSVHEADGTEPLNPPDNHYYPWSWSGLQSIDVIGSGAHDAQLVPGPALVTHRRSGSASNPGNYFNDDALYGARSVQFARGTVYMENGRFWRSAVDGSGVSGPF